MVIYLLILEDIADSVGYTSREIWMAASDVGEEGKFVWCHANSPPTRFDLNEDTFGQETTWSHNSKEDNFATFKIKYNKKIEGMSARKNNDSEILHICMVRKLMNILQQN